MADKKISELSTASEIKNGDNLELSQDTGNGLVSLKATILALATKILTNINFTSVLTTTDKTITGAINEIAEGGGGGGASTEIIADDFDATSTYAVGDYCIYDGKLYKCTTAVSTAGDWDSSDWTETLVMDEVEQGGGGGGTGGHTIIDENGTSMTARAGLQFIGGANVSDDSTNNKTVVDLASAGGIDGVFIDTDNVIQSATSIPNGTSTYTATEDCIVAYQLVATASGCNIQIDNCIIDGLLTGSNYNVVSGNAYLKKGQVIKFVQTSSDAGTYTVYGIQTGTTHSKFQPVIYSTEEREIGVWTDGKPLYEITLDKHTSPITVNAQTWTAFDSFATAIKIINAFAISVDANGEISSAYSVNAICENGYIKIMQMRSVPDAFGYVTIYYTKDSDTAGSGTWTPQGVPAVHYSEDEQIIGTWMGETLYQKTLHISNVQFDSTGVYDLDLTSMGTDVLIADNSCSYYAFSTYVRNFEKLVPEDGHIYCYGVANRPIADGYITIKYTKSS